MVTVKLLMLVNFVMRRGMSIMNTECATGDIIPYTETALT